jgi:hypothetical protein
VETAPSFERAERSTQPGQEVLPAPKTKFEIRDAKDLVNYPDGSKVVEVYDPFFESVTYMRQFPSGEMIALESDYGN